MAWRIKDAVDVLSTFTASIAAVAKKLTLTGTGGDGYVEYLHQSADPGTPGSGSDNVRLYAKSKDLYKVTDDGAGNPVVQSVTQGTVVSGTYPPSINGVANYSSGTAHLAQYSRNNDVVTVSGMVSVTRTPASGPPQWRLSLPVASNLANTYELAGNLSHSTPTVDHSGPVRGDTTNNEAQMRTEGGTDGSQDYYYHYTYLIK